MWGIVRRLGGPFIVCKCGKTRCFYSHGGRARIVVGTLRGRHGVILVSPQHVKGAKLVRRIFRGVDGRRPRARYFCLSVGTAEGLDRFVRLLTGAIVKGIPDRDRRSLGRVFRCLGRSRGQVCVTVSRFRRVTRCPRSNARTLLHSCVRFLPGMCFVFTNDGRRVVASVFLSTGQPFCRDSRVLGLPLVGRSRCRHFTGE